MHGVLTSAEYKWDISPRPRALVSVWKALLMKMEELACPSYARPARAILNDLACFT